MPPDVKSAVDEMDGLLRLPVKVVRTGDVITQ